MAVCLASCAQSGEEEPAANEQAVSVETESASVSVPDVTGTDAEDAQGTVEQANLTVTLDPDRDAAGCTVETQDPDSAQTVEPQTDVTLTLDCRQVDWEAREGDDWDTYVSGYESGFQEGCEALFLLPAGFELYVDGTPYDQTECENQAGDPSDPPTDVPDDPESDGNESGTTDGCQATFDLAGAETLYEGSVAYTAGDCDPAPAAKPAKVKQKQGKPAGTVSVPDTGPLPNSMRKKKVLTSDLYRVDRAQWNGYSQALKLRAVEAFIANNPTDCPASRNTPSRLLADAEAVLDGPGNGNFQANEVLLSMCARS